MEAKNTVMKYDSIYFRGHNIHLNAFVQEHIFDDIAQAQAEISFKAGKDEEYKQWIKACMKASMLISDPEQLVNLYKAGIREVVEWLNTKREGGYNFCVKIGWDEWQAKLKEWGIE